MDVATQKKAMAAAEVDRRGLQRYETTSRDILIAGATSMATFGIGHGIDFGIGELASHGTSQLAAQHLAEQPLADHGSRIIAEALLDPKHLLHGAWEGFQQQGNEAACYLTKEALNNGNEAAMKALSDSYAMYDNVPYLVPSEVIGIATGELGAMMAESHLASLAANNFVGWAVDSATLKKVQAVRCIDSTGSTKIKSASTLR